MSNTLGNYNPQFYANSALEVLYKQLGMAARVHRSLEGERNSAGNEKGSIVNTKRPVTFTAAQHVANTGTTAQDVGGQNVAITLDQHYEVKFAVTDVELAYASEKLINDHIAPAAAAIADNVDLALHGLGAKVGPKATLTGAVDTGFITEPRKVLRGNKVPMDRVYYGVDTGLEQAFLELEIFHAARIAGDGENKSALLQGSLGTRFGVETFVSQNADITNAAMTSTATASDASGDEAGAVNLVAGYAINESTILIDAMGTVETVEIGDTFTLAGDDTTYILTANTTMSGGAGSISFYPGLRKAVANDVVITFDNLSATQEASHYQNLMFHQNAFALVFAPLPSTGDGKGAVISTARDPITGMSVRARMWYDGDLAKNMVALDVLYGVQTLDSMMAVRALRATSIAPA